MEPAVPGGGVLHPAVMICRGDRGLQVLARLFMNYSAALVLPYRALALKRELPKYSTPIDPRRPPSKLVLSFRQSAEKKCGDEA